VAKWRLASAVLVSGQRVQEMFGRLELGRIRWQEQQMDMRGDLQLEAGMPPRPVQHQHDLPGGSGTDLARERLQLDLEERNGDTRRQVKDGAS